MKKGFTLAEVLITLAIIGVVAALTIPSVIMNYQKNMYVTQLKKEYNYFTNGFRTAMANDGVMQLSDTKLWASIPDGARVTPATLATNSELNNELSKIFNVIKIYDGDTNKIPIADESNRLVYKTINGGGFCGWNGIKSMVCLADGACFYFEFDKTSMDASCGDHYCKSLKEFQTVKNTPTKYWQRAGWITIDVNGFNKGPNQSGRDYFYFGLGNDGNLYPDYGIDQSVRSGGDYASLVQNRANYWSTGGGGCCNPNDSYSGQGCAARIIESGWKMDY